MSDYTQFDNACQVFHNMTSLARILESRLTLVLDYKPGQTLRFTLMSITRTRLCRGLAQES